MLIVLSYALSHEFRDSLNVSFFIIGSENLFMISNYSEGISKPLEKLEIDVGSRVSVSKGKETYEGILMPRISGDPHSLVIKLDNGYNIGIKYDKNVKIKKLQGKVELEKFPVKTVMHNPRKPTIAILHLGGTVASRVDYRTGGVIAAFKPEELLTMFPELNNYANIKSRLIRAMFSEDMRFEHYQLIAREIMKEINDGADGIIITHGTDTMHYTSAALAFMFEDLSIPVLLVGSQRSSDRASADAGMNLICAAKFIANSDFSGVAICMHGNSSDDFCFVFHPCKVRKMHTSRRDTFRSINAEPYAKVWYKDDKIEFLRKDYLKKDKVRKPKLLDKFEKKVGLVKFFTGFDPGILEYFKKVGYKGLVLEGTGLGHAPINVIDEFTKDHKKNLEIIRKMTKKGVIVVMTSQTIFGRVDMDVYSTGRDLLNAGVISGEDMLPEVAYVKLKWLLGNYPKEKAKELMQKNLRGEITERSNIGEFSVD